MTLKSQFLSLNVDFKFLPMIHRDVTAKNQDGILVCTNPTLSQYRIK